MNKNDIIKICEEEKNIFNKNVKDIPYEAKGIFNSEMLLFVSLAKHFDIKEAWESGRARGQSTKILAECCKVMDLYSVECDKDTDDDIVAKKRLNGYVNLQLMYGNSVDIIPSKIKNNRDTFVLIDGPKGTAAINLASILLENERVMAVFLHDYHKDSPLRSVVEERFENTFFTDDKDYVEKFRDLDDKCWIGHAKVGRHPYDRDGQKMQSYSSTLCVIFNKI